MLQSVGGVCRSLEHPIVYRDFNGNPKRTVGKVDDRNSA